MVNKKTIIEGVGFILMVVTILTLLWVIKPEVNELKGLMKDASNFRSIANQK